MLRVSACGSWARSFARGAAQVSFLPSENVRKMISNELPTRADEARAEALHSPVAQGLYLHTDDARLRVRLQPRRAWSLRRNCLADGE
jgi:hypothetical protein